MGLALSFPKEVFGFVGHYESYSYREVHNYGTWSVRRYAQAVAAETETGSGDDGSFIRLARYIGVFSTPENYQRNAVAMTTPVVSEPIAMTTPVVSGMGTAAPMRFILPSMYQRVEDAPTPTDPRVKLSLMPEKLAAALTFSGQCNGTQDAVDKYNELKAQVEASGYVVTGTWELHRFNPPYTLAPFRTNEVVVPISQA